MPNKYLLNSYPLIIVQKKKGGEESPGREEEGQGQEVTPEGTDTSKGSGTETKLSRLESPTLRRSERRGSSYWLKAGGGHLIATGAPEENCSKALSHSFVVQFW